MNPITNDILAPYDLFGRLSHLLRKDSSTVVLEYNQAEMIAPFVYIPSYRLATLAVEDEAFMQSRAAIARALKAYDAHYKSELYVKHNPWRGEGGARFFADRVRDLGLPLLGILGNTLWELGEDTGDEATYTYAQEVPVLSTSMSIALDVWHKSDWQRFSVFFDYVIEEMVDNKNLVKVNRL